MSETDAEAYDDVPYWEKDDAPDPDPVLPVRHGMRESTWSDRYPPYRPASDTAATRSRGGVEAPLPLTVLSGLLVLAACFLTLLAIGAILGAMWTPAADDEAASHTGLGILSGTIFIGSMALLRTPAADDVESMLATTAALTLISAVVFASLAGA